MFHIQQTNPLRIYFRVPQANAADIPRRAIDRCRLFRSEQEVAGESCDNLGIDHAEFRTLLVELHMENPNNEIQPGSYAQVSLTSGSLGQVVTLPNNTLLFRAQGLQVGVVKPITALNFTTSKSVAISAHHRNRPKALLSSD